MAKKTGELGPCNLEIQGICDQMKAQAEKKARKKFRIFIVISFTSQVVAGTNYFIKVDVGGDEFVHLRVFKFPLAGQTPLLENILTGKRKDEPLAPF